MIDINNYPLVIVRVLSKYLKYEGEIFTVIEPSKGIILMNDLRDNSRFYFKLLTRAESLKNNEIIVELNPFGMSITEGTQLKCSVDKLDYYLEQWVKIIKEYTDRKWFVGSPILEGFRNDYYSEFKADSFVNPNMPIPLKSIPKIEQHLGDILLKIDEYVTPENENEIRDLQIQIKQTQEALFRESKLKIANRISMIYAKVTTLGKEIFQEVLKESLKKGIYEGFHFVLEIGSNL